MRVFFREKDGGFATVVILHVFRPFVIQALDENLGGKLDAHHGTIAGRSCSVVSVVVVIFVVVGTPAGGTRFGTHAH